MSDKPDNAATVQQPAPVPGEGDVWLEVLKDVQHLWFWCNPSEKETWECLSNDMRERRNFGREKYGTYLQVENGRDYKVDLLQELLDAAVYAKGSCIKEPWNTAMHEVYRNTVLLLCRLKALMISEKGGKGNG